MIFISELEVGMQENYLFAQPSRNADDSLEGPGQAAQGLRVRVYVD